MLLDTEERRSFLGLGELCGTSKKKTWNGVKDVTLGTRLFFPWLHPFSATASNNLTAQNVTLAGIETCNDDGTEVSCGGQDPLTADSSMDDGTESVQAQPGLERSTARSISTSRREAVMLFQRLLEKRWKGCKVLHHLLPFCHLSSSHFTVHLCLHAESYNEAVRASGGRLSIESAVEKAWTVKAGFF